MGTLAGGLSHELNNVLQPVITLAHLGIDRDHISEQERKAEMTQVLKKTNPDIGIIALSGGAMHQRPGLAESFAETGAANRVLQKPVRNEELLQEVEAVLSGD